MAIRITSVDKKLTQQPDPQKLIHRVYFVLSEEPSDEWIKIFNIVNQGHVSGGRGKPGYASGIHIVVECIPDMLETYQNYMNQDVKRTNQKYAAYLEDQKINKEVKEALEQQGKEAINDAIDKLKFE